MALLLRSKGLEHSSDELCPAQTAMQGHSLQNGVAHAATGLNLGKTSAKQHKGRLETEGCRLIFARTALYG